VSCNQIAREEQQVDWSLFGCARKGHITYAPDEPDLRDRLNAPTAGGTAWRCLRCGAFVIAGPHGSGPAAAAPLVRRGKELRGELILRVFAVERFLRFLILGAAAYGVWRFTYAGGVIALNRAIAVAEIDGPEVALAALDRLQDKLAGYHAYHAARADLLRRLGRSQKSRAAYGKAIELAGNTAEIAYLTRRRDQLG
jgi:tetratricopeptide (TPR) repeat protein